MNFWEGERVRLRAVGPGDAAFFFELQGDTERNQPLDFLQPPSSRAALEDWPREQARREPKDDALQWLSERKTGERLGTTTQIVLPQKEGRWYSSFSTKPGDVVAEGAERLHLAPQEGAVLE